KEFPNMPFIAEDLGDIDEEVYHLRDAFDLPGMRVLQFAFGDDLPESVHIPHNHTFNSVVYTGTHDNNTVQGWYRNELDKAARKRIKLYTGNKIKSKNIHRVFTRLAWASQAQLVIVPVQDLTGKGPEAQMNRPSVSEGNWTWRLKTMDELFEIAGETRELLGLFAR
ncbi:MAG: 4-alpha-glucanotransferase, partial [Bacteroidota bacterium]